MISKTGLINIKMVNKYIDKKKIIDIDIVK